MFSSPKESYTNTEAELFIKVYKYQSYNIYNLHHADSQTVNINTPAKGTAYGNVAAHHARGAKLSSHEISHAMPTIVVRMRMSSAYFDAC